MQLPIHKVPKIAVQNTEKWGIYDQIWSYTRFENHSFELKFSVKRKEIMRITQPSYPICSENEDTPSNCTLYVFFSRIFIKNDLEGFITKQKILKSHGFMQVRDAWAASEQGKQNSKTGIGWGLIWKTRLETFILNMRYAILSLVEFCYLLSVLVC